MRILVTGGAGFVGRFLVRDLVAQGHEVVVLDDESTGSASVLPPGVTFHRADVTDSRAVLAAMQEADAVVHLAAKLIVAESFVESEKYRHVNVEGTRTVLDAMARLGCKKLVFSSTAAVYGEVDETAITEDAPLRPASPYGANKAEAEALLTRAAAGGLCATSLRFFNVAGAGSGLGEERKVETHLIPMALDVALGRREALRIFGTDYPTADGTAVRDYVHVADVVSAHIAALGSQGAGHRVYNVGTGVGSSVTEVVDMVEDVTGVALTKHVEPRRHGDPAVLVASPQRLMSELDWAPRSSSLRRIVTDTYEYRSARRSG